MKVHTLSVVIGGQACNAKCPFCIGKVTATKSKSNLNCLPNLMKAAQFAKDCGVTTALITGKGEPSLYPDAMAEACGKLCHVFPIVELQTNGYAFQEDRGLMTRMYQAGLTTLCLSICHYNPISNNRIYQFPEELSIRNLIKSIHSYGISVRLSCMLLKDYIDSEDDMRFLIDLCKELKVEQLTIRPIYSLPGSDRRQAIFAQKHTIAHRDYKNMVSFIEEDGTLLLNLPHGGKVYDYQGQNVCLATCMTRSTDPENIRQLIYFPDGHLRYDWDKTGAIIF